jgi:hypothetical protein
MDRGRVGGKHRVEGSVEYEATTDISANAELGWRSVAVVATEGVEFKILVLVQDC